MIPEVLARLDAVLNAPVWCAKCACDRAHPCTCANPCVRHPLREALSPPDRGFPR